MFNTGKTLCHHSNICSFLRGGLSFINYLLQLFDRYN